MDSNLNQNLITEKATARILCLHPDTLKSRRHQGKGPRHINIGDGRKPVIRYLLSDVLAYIDAHKSTAPAMEAVNA